MNKVYTKNSYERKVNFNDYLIWFEDKDCDLLICKEKKDGRYLNSKIDFKKKILYEIDIGYDKYLKINTSIISKYKLDAIDILCFRMKKD